MTKKEKELRNLQIVQMRRNGMSMSEIAEDHVVPLSRGGKHAWDNVKLACRLCNSLKSDDVIPRHPVFDVS